MQKTPGCCWIPCIDHMCTGERAGAVQKAQPERHRQRRVSAGKARGQHALTQAGSSKGHCQRVTCPMGSILVYEPHRGSQERREGGNTTAHNVEEQERHHRRWNQCMAETGTRFGARGPISQVRPRLLLRKLQQEHSSALPKDAGSPQIRSATFMGISSARSRTRGKGGTQLAGVGGPHTGMHLSQKAKQCRGVHA